MAYNDIQSNGFSEDDDDDDDSILLAETYRPCRTLYVTTSTDTYTLLNISPHYHMRIVKDNLIALLLSEGSISDTEYECALSYAGRELADNETLEDCRIGDEATVNAVVWKKDLTWRKRLPLATGNSTSKSGQDEQKIKNTKRVRSAWDSADSEEDEGHPDVVLWSAPASKKQKSVRFAEEDDVMFHPPSHSHRPLTSRTSDSQDHEMSGGLGRGDAPLRGFHDTFVEDSPSIDDLPRFRIREEPRRTILETSTPYYLPPPEPERPKYDSLRYPIIELGFTRRDVYRDDELFEFSDDRPYSRSPKREYGSSPTAVRLTPQNSNAQPLTSNLPAVPSTVYIRSSDTGSTPRSLPSSSISTSLDPAHVTITPPPEPYEPLFPLRSQDISPFKPKSPPPHRPLFSHAHKKPSPRSSKDPPISYSASNSPSTSDLFIKKYLCDFSTRPPISTHGVHKSSPRSSQPSRQPSITIPPSNPYFSRPTPSSTLQSLNPYFSTPSPLPQLSQSPSTLQSLNPYFSNTSPPPPKYSVSNPPSSNSYNFPQPTRQAPMTSDYFQAARSRFASSPPQHHPLHSPLPAPPPPPHITVEPPTPTRLPYSHRPPPADRIDRSPSPSSFPNGTSIPDHLQADLSSNTNMNTNSKTKTQSQAPTRKAPPPPTPPLLHTQRLHSPPHSPPPPPKKQKPYQLPRVPIFYKYHPLPTPVPTPTPTSPTRPPPPPPSESKPSAPPPPSIPPSRPTKPSTKSTTKPTYYSSHTPLPANFTLKGAIVIPSLAHQILPPEFLEYRTVRQLIKVQGWEMSQGEWWGVRRVLELEDEREGKEGGKGGKGRDEEKGERGARGNLEVLVRGVVELEKQREREREREEDRRKIKN